MQEASAAIPLYLFDYVWLPHQDAKSVCLIRIGGGVVAAGNLQDAESSVRELYHTPGQLCGVTRHDFAAAAAGFYTGEDSSRI